MHVEKKKGTWVINCLLSAFAGFQRDVFFFSLTHSGASHDSNPPTFRVDMDRHVNQ